MQKVLSVFGCFVLIFALCTGCSRTSQAEKKTFYAMNTTMEFTVYGSASLVDDAEALINSLEDELSVTKDTSEIAQINQNGSGTVTGSTADLMGKALAMCSRTNGTLDISVYPMCAHGALRPAATRCRARRSSPPFCRWSITRMCSTMKSPEK